MTPGKPTIRLICVRHGKDIKSERELSDLGRRQAAKLGDALKAFDIDHILTSDLMRAYQTFEIIREELDGGIACSVTSSLREIDPYFSLVGVKPENMPADKIPVMKEELDGINNFISAICELNGESKTFLLVTHGHFIRYLLSLACFQKQPDIYSPRLSPEALYRQGVIDRKMNVIVINNAAITIIDVAKDEAPRIIGINDTSHLADDELS